jgi:hypothetical protein
MLVLFVIATVSEAIQGSSKNWIASSQELLAMTSTERSHGIAKHHVLEKKEQGTCPAQKLCRPYFPEIWI